jgi:hypothetical protein
VHATYESQAQHYARFYPKPPGNGGSLVPKAVYDSLGSLLKNPVVAALRRDFNANCAMNDLVWNARCTDPSM